MAITFDGQNDRITTTSSGLTVPTNVSGTFQAGGLSVGAGGTVITTNSSGLIGIGTNRPTRPFEVWSGSSSASLSIDTSGRITTPFQPIFYAYQTGSAAGTALGAFTNQFNTTLINVGNCYSTSTGRFTAPIAGNYRFDAKFLARHSGAVGALEFTFYRNGSNIVGRSFCYTYVTAASDHDVMYANLYITLAVNDYIQVGFTVLSAGTDYYYGENLSSFSGQLIG